MASRLKLFAPQDTSPIGAAIASAIGTVPAQHEEREFEDGEHKARALESVRECDVYVVQSLYADHFRTVNDKLVRLLFFVGALKDAGAARVTAVVPYLCYARKDRRSKPRDPLSSRYVAALFEAVGADRVVTLDVHNLAAYENAFRIEAVHLEAKRLFVDALAARVGADPVCVVSPDVGGVKRADAFAASLARRLGRPVSQAFMEKRRSEGVVSGEALVGEVAGRMALVIDDLIASGGTLDRAVSACARHGSKRVYAAATHGLFTAKAVGLLSNAALDRLFVTDSVPPFRLAGHAAAEKIEVVSCVPLIAESIRRLHAGASVAALLED